MQRQSSCNGVAVFAIPLIHTARHSSWKALFVSTIFKYFPIVGSNKHTNYILLQIHCTCCTYNLTKLFSNAKRTYPCPKTILSPFQSGKIPNKSCVSFENHDGTRVFQDVNYNCTCKSRCLWELRRDFKEE